VDRTSPLPSFFPQSSLFSFCRAMMSASTWLNHHVLGHPLGLFHLPLIVIYCN
jgi:hypothetical protein